MKPERWGREFDLGLLWNEVARNRRALLRVGLRCCCAMIVRTREKDRRNARGVELVSSMMRKMKNRVSVSSIFWRVRKLDR
jgi:hypothetical protein